MLRNTPRDVADLPECVSDSSSQAAREDARFGISEDFCQYIKEAEEELAELPPGSPYRARCLYNLSCYLFMQFQFLGNTIDLDQAIHSSENAVAIALDAPDDPDQAPIMAHLSACYLQRFEQLGVQSDIEHAVERGEQAVERGEQAVAASDPEDSDQPARLGHLSDCYFTWFQSSRELDYLEQAIKQGAKALAALPEENPDRGARLRELSCCFHERFGLLGVPADLEKAIQHGTEALAATSPGHPDRASMLGYLSSYLFSRYQSVGELIDLDQAITQDEEVIELLSAHPMLATYLCTLSERYHLRFLRLESLADLQRAIELGEQALTVTTLGDPGRSQMLCDMASYLADRFEQLGAKADLDLAIKRGEEGVSTTSGDLSDRGNRLRDLASHFHRRYLLTGEVGDLEQSIEMGEAAVELIPATDRGRAGLLSHVGQAFYDRYKRLGVSTDLERGIGFAEQAVSASDMDGHSKARRLNSLSCYLARRFEWLGALTDLDRAIQCAESALPMIPSDHCHRPNMLQDLSSRYYRRFERFGALGDLQRAIQSCEEALASMPDFPNRVPMLGNLSGYLVKRFGRLGALDDLEKAIVYGAEAIKSPVLDYPDRAGTLGNLATCLCTRFTLAGEVADLEEATQHLQAAVDLLPLGHFIRSNTLHNLATCFQTKFKHSGVLTDLDMAIQWYQEALVAAPPDYFNRGRTLIALGLALRSRSGHTGIVEDTERSRSIDVFLQAWQCLQSPPLERIHAARMSAVTMLLGFQPRWDDSGRLLEKAVNLLPMVSPRFLERDDQQYMLCMLRQLAAHAASILLHSGVTPAHCLMLLELGRGIITGLTIDCRSNLPRYHLREENTEYAEIFDSLNRLRIEIDSWPTDQHTMGHRIKTSQALDETLDDIRRLPGLERFQLPPVPEDIMAMAREGPIVIFNSNQFRHDALIVTCASIKAVPLLNLEYYDVKKRMRQLTRELVHGARSSYPSRNEQMNEHLLWLWDAAVEPVFQELGLSSVDVDDKLPRIWWIGVGALAMAPFHAAGDHSTGSTRNTISRVISSYIPTIKSLSYARERELGLLHSPESRLLLVTMPTTPNHRPLKNAIREVEEIERVVNARAIVTRMDSPSAANVLHELPSFNAIHFACHGVSDASNPSNSHLLLRGVQDSDLMPASVDRLSALAISNIHIKSAQLAYLSACCTADNPSTDLSDESIHIASGFILAGFSHVLATLWDSNDLASQQIATDFYRFLFSGQEGGGHRAVSTAFHQAQRKLRAANLRQPIKWATFIHTGA